MLKYRSTIEGKQRVPVISDFTMLRPTEAFSYSSSLEMNCYSSLQPGKVLEPAPLHSASIHRPPKKGFCGCLESDTPTTPLGPRNRCRHGSPGTGSPRRCRQRPAGTGAAPGCGHGRAPPGSPSAGKRRPQLPPPPRRRARAEPAPRLHPRERLLGRGPALRGGRGPPGRQRELGPQHGHSPRAGRCGPAPRIERERCGEDARRGCSGRMRAELNATLCCEGSGSGGGRYLKGHGGPEAAASWRGRRAGPSRLLLPLGAESGGGRPALLSPPAAVPANGRGTARPTRHGPARARRLRGRRAPGHGWKLRPAPPNRSCLLPQGGFVRELN